MSRTITAAARTESLSSAPRPVLLVKLEFDSGDLRVWSGAGDMTFDSETYSGVGHLGAISAVEEGVEAKAFGISLELAGIPPSTISVALAEDVLGRACRVWLGFLDGDGALIADPMLAFQGRMDTMDVTIGETATVNIVAESRLIDWDRPRIRRYTDADQQERYPGDLGLEFVSQTVEKELVWGKDVVHVEGGAGNTNDNSI